MYMNVHICVCVCLSFTGFFAAKNIFKYFKYFKEDGIENIGNLEHSWHKLQTDTHASVNTEIYFFDS